jgi:hypothetical protein
VIGRASVAVIDAAQDRTKTKMKKSLDSFFIVPPLASIQFFVF